MTPEAPDDPAGAQPQLTPEMFEGMLATDAGRSLLISSIAEEAGIDAEAAECLLDSIPVDVLVEAAGAFLGGTDGGFFSAARGAEMAPLLDACGIAADAFTS